LEGKYGNFGHRPVVPFAEESALMPPRASIYLALTVIAAFASVASICVLYPSLPDLRSAYYLAFLTPMVALARRFPLHLSEKKRLFPHARARLAPLLLPPPPYAVLACSLGKGAVWSSPRARSSQKLFSTAATAVRSSIAAAVHLQAVHLVGDGHDLSWLPAAT